jgi:hypothetical protein
MGTNMKRSHRVIAAAAAAAIALTSLGTVSASAASRGVTRHHAPVHHVYRRGGGNAAAFGLFAATLGTIATLAARDRYYDDGYYGRPYYAPYPAYGYGYRRW